AIPELRQSQPGTLLDRSDAHAPVRLRAGDLVEKCVTDLRRGDAAPPGSAQALHERVVPDLSDGEAIGLRAAGDPVQRGPLVSDPRHVRGVPVTAVEAEEHRGRRRDAGDDVLGIADRVTQIRPRTVNAVGVDAIRMETA